MSTMNSSSVSGNNQDTGVFSGSLLAQKGGFQNLKNKDEIRDKMLASLNKIKSFRESGEFDLSDISVMQSASRGLSEIEPN